MAYMGTVLCVVVVDYFFFLKNCPTAPVPLKFLISTGILSCFIFLIFAQRVWDAEWQCVHNFCFLLINFFWWENNFIVLVRLRELLAGVLLVDLPLPRCGKFFSAGGSWSGRAGNFCFLLIDFFWWENIFYCAGTVERIVGRSPSGRFASPSVR